MKAALGRADLVRLIADLAPEPSKRVAALLGFEAPIEAPARGLSDAEIAAIVAANAEADAKAEAEAAASPAAEPPVEAKPAARPGPMPFWRIESMTFANEIQPQEVAVRAADRLTDDDLVSPGRSLFQTPKTPPLEPWSRLWPRLRGALQTAVPGREPDIPKVVRALARGELLNLIPRVTRTAWSERASVWVDRSPRLAPFAEDQTDVCRRLRRLIGKSGLHVRTLDRRTQAWSVQRRGDMLLERRGHELCVYRADPGTPVLVLGDLGIYGGPSDREAWLRSAQRLERADVRLTALLPVPPSRWDPALARAWLAIGWERGRSREGVAVGEEPRFGEERVERLLRLASMAAWIQPGLVRALRRLLPARDTDAATEVDMRSHPDVRSADAAGLVLHPEAASRWRRRFVEEVDADLKARVSRVIKHWHEGLPQELLRAETLVWHALVPGSVAAPPGDLNDALGFARRLEATVHDGLSDSASGAMIQRFGRSMLGPDDAGLYEKVPELKAVWAASFDGMDDVPIPKGIDIGAIREALRKGREAPRYWAVRQVGSELRVSPSPWGAVWPCYLSDPGSPIAILLAASPTLSVTRHNAGLRVQRRLCDGLAIPLRPRDAITLETDSSTVAITPWRRAPWATYAGVDRYGLWAAVDVRGVVQRFRWIPPGRFSMGSPETEAGRWDNEGPQHLVTWTKGRWIADTPVTQALWQAVTGTNPSYFKSPERPVEMVSWEDCAEFITKLNAIKPGLAARLPTEAEWECACRGGTSTATWVGDLEIVGENNAPLLDSIAWYGGNSGEGFELTNGVDSSAWPNKQHAHTSAGTRLVREKRPNPYGLYDMLGNVFEWCVDAESTYSNDAVVDPHAVRTGSGRVVRGGSWRSVARYVRAALRLAFPPESRGYYLGFRLARGPAPGQEASSKLRSSEVSRGAGRDRDLAPTRGAGRDPAAAPTRDAAAPLATKRSPQK